MKKGALKGVRVVKFKADDRQYLLAYYFFPKPNVIEILDVGGQLRLAEAHGVFEGRLCGI